MNKSKKIVLEIICRNEDAESVRDELAQAIFAYWRGSNFNLYFPKANVVETTNEEEQDFLEVTYSID